MSIRYLKLKITRLCKKKTWQCASTSRKTDGVLVYKLKRSRLLSRNRYK